jgi:hypothetical protein
VIETGQRDLNGRPIHGDIDRGHRIKTDQWDAAKFLEMLDAVLTQPGVQAVRWTQATPYFNDGETCYFGVHEMTVKVSDPDAPDAENQDDEDDWDDDDEYRDGFKDSSDLGLELDWNEQERRYIKVVTDATHPAALPLRELVKATGHFYTVLLDAFGDHAEITATTAGFTVESYEHE